MLPNLGEIWLATLLADFHQRYPDIEIVLIEATTLPFENLLVRGQLNVALLHQMPTGLPSTLVSYPLFTEALVLAVNVNHPLATQSQVSLADLHDESWILIKAGSAIREEILNAMTAAGFTPHIVCESRIIIHNDRAGRGRARYHYPTRFCRPSRPNTIKGNPVRELIP